MLLIIIIQILFIYKIIKYYILDKLHEDCNVVNPIIFPTFLKRGHKFSRTMWNKFNIIHNRNSDFYVSYDTICVIRSVEHEI